MKNKLISIKHSSVILAEYLGEISARKIESNTVDWPIIEKQIIEALGLENQDIASMVLNSIFRPLIQTAPREKIRELFDEGFVSGTFNLNERLEQPPFIAKEDNENLREWVKKQVDLEVSRMMKADPFKMRWLHLIKQESPLELSDRIFLMLFLKFEDGKRLMDKIPNQLFQDVFIRMISIFLWRHPYAYPDSDADYNAKAASIALKMLPRIQNLSLKELFNYSLAAGALAVDMKSSASAASTINKTTGNIIFYNIGDETEEARLERMFSELSTKASRLIGIDSWTDFEKQIVNSNKPVKLVWFPDDVAETIFDLLFIQKLLETNQNLSVVMVPRTGLHGYRFGNDASSKDIFSFVNLNKTDTFMSLWQNIFDQRFTFSNSGPSWGAVCGPDLSEEVVDHILDSEAILVKGSRSYEMLQGINKDAYFASMGCREFTQSCTQVDSELGLLLSIYQPAGLPSFSGFRNRHLKEAPLFPTDRLGNVTTMTALEFQKAIHSPQYQQILKQFPDKLTANHWIKSEATKSGKTIAKVINDYSIE